MKLYRCPYKNLNEIILIIISNSLYLKTTYRLSDTFLDDAIGSYLSTILLKHILRDYAYSCPGPMTV